MVLRTTSRGATTCSRSPPAAVPSSRATARVTASSVSVAASWAIVVAVGRRVAGRSSSARAASAPSSSVGPPGTISACRPRPWRCSAPV